MHLFGIRHIRYFFRKKEREVFVIKKNFVPLQPQKKRFSATGDITEQLFYRKDLKG